MRKREKIIQNWRTLKEKTVKMRGIPVDHKGSTFAEDSLRITGSQEFIDSVLSQNKWLLSQESDTQELDIAYAEITDSPGRFYCTIKLKDRAMNRELALVRKLKELGNILNETSPEAARELDRLTSQWTNN